MKPMKLLVTNAAFSFILCILRCQDMACSHSKGRSWTGQCSLAHSLNINSQLPLLINIVLSMRLFFISVQNHLRRHSWVKQDHEQLCASHHCCHRQLRRFHPELCSVPPEGAGGVCLAGHRCCCLRLGKSDPGGGRWRSVFWNVLPELQVMQVNRRSTWHRGDSIGAAAERSPEPHACLPTWGPRKSVDWPKLGQGKGWWHVFF